ncbi:MAG: hypothetical protein KGN76_04865, partial [Acidobacteriota bacterium]|nr:hypothetical protein [Acidobacteriota bacterium]
MPYIRFTRDRRGYEHTCVMHAGRRGRKQGRLLYWFRTPPNVKVGRVPIDEDAIRTLEQQNPDLTFDWARMLEVRPPAPVEPAAGRRRRREGEGGPRETGRGSAGRRTGRPGGTRQMPPEPVEVPVAAAAPAEPFGEEPASGVHLEPPAEMVLMPSTPPDVPESARPVPVEELVGAEGLARLRTRYAEVQARLTERAQRGGDEARLAQLRQEAEALNPDAWVTLAEAREALERSEAVFDGLRRALGRRRRSRRGGARRSRRRQAAAG